MRARPAFFGGRTPTKRNSVTRPAVANASPPRFPTMRYRTGWKPTLRKPVTSIGAGNGKKATRREAFCAVQRKKPLWVFPQFWIFGFLADKNTRGSQFCRFVCRTAGRLHDDQPRFVSVLEVFRHAGRLGRVEGSASVRYSPVSWLQGPPTFL